MTLEFSHQGFEKSSNIKFHENLSVEAELFHVNGWTEMKLTVAFGNFAKEPKNTHIVVM